MNSGNGTSVFGLHAPHFHPAKFLLFLVILFVFTMVPATYWQFLERGKSSDTAVLVDHIPTNNVSDDEHESIEEYLDDVLKLVDDLSANARLDAVTEAQDDIPADVPPLMSEPEENTDISAEASLENESDLIEDLPADARIENERTEEWLGSHN